MWLANSVSDFYERQREANEMKCTVLCCEECRKLVGWELKDRIGGNVHLVPCQLCGKETYLGEYPSNITAAAIRENMNQRTIRTYRKVENMDTKDYEELFHELMDAVKRSRMEHGDCKSGKRYGGIPKACTACMAQRKLDEMINAYKGRTIRLA